MGTAPTLLIGTADGVLDGILSSVPVPR